MKKEGDPLEVSSAGPVDGGGDMSLVGRTSEQNVSKREEHRAQFCSSDPSKDSQGCQSTGSSTA